MSPERETRKKPHSIWTGIIILIVLLLFSWLSGNISPFAALIFALLFVPPTLGAILAAFTAARLKDLNKVVAAAKGLCVLFTAFFIAIPSVVAATWLNEKWELAGAAILIDIVASLAVAPFSAAYAVYRYARRSGKSHEDAQQMSRWDPKHFL